MSPKGCSKCGSVQNHKTSSCKKPYPPYNEQVCDECIQAGHEFRDCDDKMGEPCKICGHGACRKICQVLGGKNYLEIGQDLADQFTPKAREIWLVKCEEASRAPNAAVPSASTASISAASNAGVAASGISSTLAEDLTTISISDEDPYADMTDRQKQKAKDQRKWDQELSNLTKAPDKRSERPKNSKLPSEGFSIVKANFFSLILNPSIKLYRYSISLGSIEVVSKDGGESRRFVPTNRDTKRHLMNSMLTQVDSQPLPVAGVAWASDFDSTIISAGELYAGLTLKNPTQVVCHTRTGQNSSKPTMESQVRYLGLVAIDDLVKHCSNPCNSAANYLPDEDLKALNIISWTNINSNTFDGGRRGNKFYPADILDEDQEHDKNNRLYMIRKGFFSSMRPGQDSVLLNINTTTSAFYSPIPLATWIELRWNRSPLILIQENDRKKFQRTLKGVRVIFEAESLEKQRKRTIFDISDKNLGETTFAKEKGNPETNISVFDHLTQAYPSQAPSFQKNDYCINLGSRADKRWYPAKLLRIVDWQPITKVLEGTHADEMLRIAQVNPMESQSRIDNYALRHLGLKDQNSGFYKNFGITFDENPQFLQLEPVFCNATSLEFKRQQNHSNKVLARNAEWSLTKQHFHEPKLNAKDTKLGVLSFCNGLPGDSFAALRDAMKQLGMGGDFKLEHNTQTPPPLIAPPSAAPTSQSPASQSLDSKYRTRCQRTLEAARKELNKNGKVLLIIVILPNQDNDLYAEIKRWGIALPAFLHHVSQCESWQSAVPTGISVQISRTLKINFKLKGVSHRTSEQRCGADQSTMIMGADVTHPSPENAAKGCPSIAAVVATNDDDNNVYLGSARLQKGKQEFIADLKGMVHERLAAWYKKSVLLKLPVKERLPKNLIFYRDGVSESQYGMVRSEEMPQIQAAFQTIYEAIKKNGSLMSKYNPKLTIIVVTKRHHTRFYPSDATLTKNIEPGLVIDTDVITPNQFSFYLQSHASPLGTARSSHYVVLEDGQNFRDNPFKLQELTNKICYVSARATQALRVCTPARYADILCDRLRCYMKPALDHRDTYRPASIPNDTAAEFDADGDYSGEYGADQFIWKCLVGDEKQKNPWHESMNDIMFYL